VVLNRPDPDAGTRRRRAWPVVLVAVAIFGLLASLPVILPALHLQLHPAAPNSRYGVTLITAPRSPRTVRVPAVATPIDPSLPAAALPTTNPARETATLSADDQRLRVMLHDASSVYQPEVIPVRGSLPTLVLTAGTYTAATLVQYGALVMLPHQAALLLDNVYVSTNASLSLGGPTVRTLYLDSGSGGFTSIVAWDGNLAFHGTSSQPMTVMGWDRSTSSPAADVGSGRPYLREAGGDMTLTDVRVTSMGFWSGRTSGVSWTGLSGKPSTGGATSSTFTGDTYGAFVSRGSGLTFRDDLFEFNALDGLHIHRYSQNTTVVSSSAVRNGANGFAVSQATQNTLLEGDISERNGGNGFFLNGRPLATGASASGGSIAPGSGTTVEDSAALNNGQIGILAEGGTGTVIKGDQVCAAVTAVAVRDTATDAVVTGNTVWCHPSSGFTVGPYAPGTVLAGNAVDGARTAFLVRAAGHVEMDSNLVTNATVFGVSSRGASSTVTGTSNTFAGTGFRAIDAREGAPMPALYATSMAGWAVHTHLTFLSYLQFHPLAALWLGVLALAVLAWAWSRMRRRPSHPYSASTQWTGESWAIATPEVAEVAEVAEAAEVAPEAAEADARYLRQAQPVGAAVHGVSAAADAEPLVTSWPYAEAGRGTGAAPWQVPGSQWPASEPFQRVNPAGPTRNGREGQW
jgi:Right handed beta helix region